MSRICVMTGGHLSTCPRMLKAAEALAGAGYDVRVVSGNFEPWASAADELLRSRLKLRCTVVDYSRATANAMRVRAGLRYRICRAMAATVGANALPSTIIGCAMNRIAPELVRAATSEPADLIYSGGGVLVPAALAAKRLGIPYAVDLEDFHSGFEPVTTSQGRLDNAISAAAENVVFREAAFLTTASDGIADEYSRNYGRRPLVINNTFPLPALAPDFSSSNSAPLRLYWFSQTIGPGRGLEEAVQAAGLSDAACELHLRGKAIPQYISGLRGLAAQCAPKLKIVQHDPVPPDEIITSCHDMDIGLALEQAQPLGRELCLTNKAFTYILAGLAVVFTDTPGQRTLARDLGEGAWLYQPGDVESFAAGLKLWAEDPEKLISARRAAWEASCRRWHWEHEEERGRLLRAVQSVVPLPTMPLTAVAQRG